MKHPTRSRYHQLYIRPELRAQWMRTKPVTRDELLAMAARAQAQPIADHYPGKRTAKGVWKALNAAARSHFDP